MLTITQAQMDLMSAAMHERFEKAMAAHARATFPAETAQASDAQLFHAIRFVVQQGQGYGIVFQDDLRRFMELFFSHGPHFLSQARFAPLLAALQLDDVDGTQKMDEVDRIERAVLMGRL